MAVKEATPYNIVTANKPWTWIIPFIKTIKYSKPNEKSIYNIIYKNKIEKYTLLFKKVTSDFKKELNKKEEKGRGKVAKGSFGSIFDRVKNDKNSIKKNLKEKKRVIIIQHKYIICERPAYKNLKAYYYTFLKIVPKRGALSAYT